MARQLQNVLLADQPVADRLGRPLQTLRISVLDRCNFRCGYCMPEDALSGRQPFVPRRHWLSDCDLERVVRACVTLGVGKIRITGGEPLLRPGLVGLVERLAAIDGVRDIALTTNGVLLPQFAELLAGAGLNRITVSLDSLDPEVFHRMNGGKSSVAQVLHGIAAALQAGFDSLKINTVVERGVNDHTVMDLLSHFRGSGHAVRLIEFMDVGHSNRWSPDQVVPSREWVQRIHRRWPIEALEEPPLGRVARRYKYCDGAGEIGFISSISEPFCGGCDRARITADGRLYTCLFATRGHALAPLLQETGSAQALEARIGELWSRRGDRYSEQRHALGLIDTDDAEPKSQRVEMYRIGG